MSLPSVIDLDTLIRPFGDDLPSGPDPRADPSAQSLYYKVKDARSSARAAERANVDSDAAPPESWGLVVSNGVDLLGSQSKDLEIAAWTTEGLVRLEGFAGLRDGLLLLRGLVQTFWDSVHPLPDEDDDGVEGRLTAVAALSGAGTAGTLAQSLRTVPLVGIARPYSIWNFDQASELEKLTDPARKAARIAAGSPSMEMFRESLAETPTRDLVDTLETIEESGVALRELGEALDKAAGYDAPSFTALRDLIEHIGSSIRHFGAEKLAAHAKAVERDAPKGTDAGAPSDGAASWSGASASDGWAASGAGPAPAVPTAGGGGTVTVNGFANREEALNAVLTLADYFRRTEPQSPISYTLAEAVRRARMPLLDLLHELTNDPAHISRFTLAAGMRIENRNEIAHTQPAVSQPASSYASSAAPAHVAEDAYAATPTRSSDGW